MILQPSDLSAFAEVEAAKAEQMIADAEAMASMVAPCITDPEFLADAVRVAQVKAILRGAVLRWHDAGSGAITQATAGAFNQTVDTRTDRKGMFWPSEIVQLRDICSEFAGGSYDAGGVDMIYDEATRVSLATRPDLWFQWGTP